MPGKKSKTDHENIGPCAVLDWENKLMKGKSILPDWRKMPGFSEAMGNKGWELFSSFRLTALPGAPRVGDVSAPWLEELVRFWLGAQDPKTRARIVPEMLLLTAKKSTKTSSMALLTLTQFVMTKRKNAQALIVAPTKQVADLAFRLIVGAVESTPGLEDQYKIAYTERTIRDQRGFGWRTQLKVSAADLSSLSGTTAQYILLDELHLLSRLGTAEEMMTHVRGARTGQADASCIMCTTHSHDIATGVWAGELESYRKIRNGELNSNRLFVGYEFPNKLLENGKYLNPKWWHCVNPNIGVTATIEGLEDELKVASARSMEARAQFLNQFLNTPAGIHRADNAWPGIDYWDECVDKGLGLKGVNGLLNLLDRSESVTIGIDGGGLGDLLGFAAIGRERGTRRWLLWVHAWVHNKVLANRPSLGEKLKHFQKKGDLSIVDYTKTSDGYRPLNLTEMGELISYIQSTGLLAEKESIGIDNLAMVHMVDAMVDEQLDYPAKIGQIVKIRQGYSLQPAIYGMAQKLAIKELMHGGQDLMRWSVGNVVMVPKGNAVTVEKSATLPDRKIDPFIAMLCAGYLMMKAPEGRTMPSAVGIYH